MNEAFLDFQKKIQPQEYHCLTKNCKNYNVTLWHNEYITQSCYDKFRYAVLFAKIYNKKERTPNESMLSFIHTAGSHLTIKPSSYSSSANWIETIESNTPQWTKRKVTITMDSVLSVLSGLVDCLVEVHICIMHMLYT